MDLMLVLRINSKQCGALTAACCNAQVVLPLLGGLLLYQYSVLIGLPPGLHWGTLRYHTAAWHPATPALGSHRTHHHSRPPDAPSTAVLLKVRSRLCKQGHMQSETCTISAVFPATSAGCCCRAGWAWRPWIELRSGRCSLRGASQSSRYRLLECAESSWLWSCRAQMQTALPGCVSTRCTGRRRIPLSTEGVQSQMTRCQVSCRGSCSPWQICLSVDGSAFGTYFKGEFAASKFLSHCRPIPATLRRWHQGAAAGRPCRGRVGSTRQPGAGQRRHHRLAEQRPRPAAVGAAGV